MRIIIGLCLLFVAQLGAADIVTGNVAVAETSGTTTVEILRDRDRLTDRTACYVIDWLSDAAGAVTVSFEASGLVQRAVTNPDGGALAPTDDYDILLNDADGIDILQGYGGNRDTANSEQIAPLIHDTGTATSFTRPAMCGTVTLLITNAGNANAGTIRIYVEK